MNGFVRKCLSVVATIVMCIGFHAIPSFSAEDYAPSLDVEDFAPVSRNSEVDRGDLIANSVDDRPEVWVFVSPPGEVCKFCDVELLALRSLNNSLPFRFVVRTDRPSWLGVELRPVTYWGIDGDTPLTSTSWKMVQGWHGIKVLTDSFNGSRVTRTNESKSIAAAKATYVSVSRSPQWPAVRDNWLKKCPDCICCGRQATTVHHDEPVHLNPSRELDTTNFDSVCDECHFLVAHLGNWQNYNSKFREHAHLLMEAKRAADADRRARRKNSSQ